MPGRERSKPLAQRCTNSNQTLKIVLFRRAKRLYASDVECFQQPALILSVHSSSNISIALHLLLKSPLAVAIRFPERVQSIWDCYRKATGGSCEMILVGKRVLKPIREAVASGKIVSLYPDHGHLINPSCFKLVEEGTPFAFHYSTVTRSGVPVLKYQSYSGSRSAEACAQAFLRFLDDECGLCYELAQPIRKRQPPLPIR